MAQAGGAGNTLASLFSELHRFGENGDYDRALKVANKSKIAYSSAHLMPTMIQVADVSYLVDRKNRIGKDCHMLLLLSTCC
jgi:hypothetical protein